MLDAYKLGGFGGACGGGVGVGADGWFKDDDDDDVESEFSL